MVSEEGEDDADFEYKLVGILIHMGGAQAGHYISYIKHETDKWYEFND